MMSILFVNEPIMSGKSNSFIAIMFVTCLRILVVSRPGNMICPYNNKKEI